MTTAKRFQRFADSFCQPPFRGDINENCQRFKFVGPGYKSMPSSQNGHFMLESARHLAGPLAALLDPFVRITHIIGATQVLKSMSGETWVIYVFEHLRLSILILFEDQDKAKLFASERLITTIREHPGLSRSIAETLEENRHKITGTKIKLPGATMLVAGLNEGNVSTLSWPVIWVSEAWQHGSDGLLFKAFKRADRFADTAKILNESQASLVGTDLHTATKDAHPVPLEWRCPACDGVQTWERRHWSFKRPDDFKPRENRLIVPVTIGDSTATIWEPPKPGTYAGMSWGLDTPTTQDNRTVEEKARSAHWRCVHCDYRIDDTKENRQAIAKTYSQNYKLITAGQTVTPREVCFTLPFESNVDNRFESTVKKFLSAKSASDFVNKKPLEDWYLADRAFFYDPALDYQSFVISPGSYDPAMYREIMGDGFHSVNMMVDCQQDQEMMDRTGKSMTGWFWFIIRAVDKFGNSKQLARGFCKSWDELLRHKAKWAVPTDRVCIDVGQWGTQIMQKAVECRETVKLDKPMGIYRVTQKDLSWYLFSAENTRKGFPHTDNNFRMWSLPQRVPVPLLDSEGKRRTIFLQKIRFDRKTFNQQLDALWGGAPGMPKFEILSRELLDEQSRNMEMGDRTYSQQLSAKVYDPAKNDYKELRPDDHYQWCEIAFLVRTAMDGLFGAAIATPQ